MTRQERIEELERELRELKEQETAEVTTSGLTGKVFVHDGRNTVTKFGDRAVNGRVAYVSVKQGTRGIEIEADSIDLKHVELSHATGDSRVRVDNGDFDELLLLLQEASAKLRKLFYPT